MQIDAEILCPGLLEKWSDASVSCNERRVLNGLELEPRGDCLRLLHLGQAVYLIEGEQLAIVDFFFSRPRIFLQTSN